jgi:hypothetical protein
MSTSNAEDQGATETVDLPEPDADEGGGGSSAESSQGASGGEQRQTRKERRQSEFQTAQETARLAREEAAAERRERERLATEVAELRGRWEQSQQQQQRDAKDPYADKISALEDEAQLILEQISNTKDRGEQKELLKKYNAKMREAAKLDFKREQETQERDTPRQQQQQGMSPRDVAMWTALEADYPMIANKDRSGAEFRATADLYINRLLASGKPDNLATLRAACALAAKELKIGGHDERASNGQRAAYGGHANGDGGGGRGDNGAGKVEWGPQQRAMAMAMANRLGKGYDEAEAKAEWLKRVGPGVARRMQSDE